MPTDIFAKIGDIKGESLDGSFKEQIELMSWSWGLNQPGSSATGSGAGKGKASFNDFSFVHKLDKASPNLAQMCANGKHFPEVTITQRKATGDGQKEFLIYKFSEVFVTNINQSGSEGGDVIEQVSLEYSKVVMEYKPQKGDGTLDSAVYFKYDVKANKAL